MLINASFAGGLVEEKLDLLEETGFTVIIEFGSELRLGGLSSELSEDGALSKSGLGDDGRKSLHVGWCLCDLFCFTKFDYRYRTEDSFMR